MPVGSGSGFQNSDLLEPDPAENGPDPQHCSQPVGYRGTYGRVRTGGKDLLLHGEGDDDIVLLCLGPGGSHLLPKHNIN